MSQVVIDQLGKIEIPQSVRELLGLKPGQHLSLETDDLAGAIQLRPLFNETFSTPTSDLEARLVEENGFLVIEGVEGLNTSELIEQDRKDRFQKLMKGISL